MNASVPIIRVAGEGDKQAFLGGGLHTWKLMAEDTGGEFFLFEDTLSQAKTTPLHRHPESDETVYVLEGRIRYHINGETFEGRPGSTFHVPAGTLENFEPVEQSRLLVLYTPGGIEKFFAEAGEAALTRELPPPSSEPPDFERIVEIAAKYGMNIQPPA